MNEKQWFAWLLALSLAVGAGVWWFQLREPDAGVPEPAEVAVATPEPAPPPPTAPEYPVPETPAVESPLPTLADSDGDFLEQLRGLLGAPGVEAVLVPGQLIRRLVVAVDNLPRERLARRDWPLRRGTGSLVVSDAAGGYALQRDNGARYRLAVALVKAVDAEALARLYFRYYPLFNQAYRELGYPQGHFNDRLVQVIDHVLAAPVPTEPILLSRQKVMYEFADPRLEALSFGQKLMIRLGAENRVVVAGKLREIRAPLVRGLTS